MIDPDDLRSLGIDDPAATLAMVLRATVYEYDGAWWHDGLDPDHHSGFATQAEAVADWLRHYREWFETRNRYEAVLPMLPPPDPDGTAVFVLSADLDALKTERDQLRADLDAVLHWATGQITPHGDDPPYYFHEATMGAEFPTRDEARADFLRVCHRRAKKEKQR